MTPEMKEIKIKTIKELTVQGNASSHAGQCELPTSWEGTERSVEGHFSRTDCGLDILGLLPHSPAQRMLALKTPK